MKTNSQNPSLLLEYAHNALGPLKPSIVPWMETRRGKGKMGRTRRFGKCRRLLSFSDCITVPSCPFPRLGGESDVGDDDRWAEEQCPRIANEQNNYSKMTVDCIPYTSSCHPPSGCRNILKPVSEVTALGNMFAGFRLWRLGPSAGGAANDLGHFVMPRHATAWQEVALAWQKQREEATWRGKTGILRMFRC